MGSKVYVGGLPYSATEAEVETLFAEHGTVESARVITDKYTGQSRGFGFVEMSTPEEAQAAIRGPEVTRFKGLGEISPQEFKDFIGDGMRLTEARLESVNNVPGLLQFYMGKNTPERKTYIMDHLVVDATA